MPKSKTYVALILGVAIVASVWILKKPSGQLPNQEKSGGSLIAVENTKKLSNDTDAEWKKILTEIATSSKVAVKAGTNVFDDTTLTAQMAKDFFAQYLNYAQGGRSITPEESEQIAENILRLPEYTKVGGAVYLTSNIYITENNDKQTIKKYFDLMNLAIKNNIPNNDDDPLYVLDKAVRNDNPKELEKLDLIINAGKKMIAEMLNIEVPRSAIAVHLNLLNASSDSLYDVESMRVSFEDPVRSFVATSNYVKHLTAFQESLYNLADYFAKNLK